MTATVVGIDPGMHGAIAILYGGELAEIHDMPVLVHELADGTKRKQIHVREVAAILAEVEPDRIAIEEMVGIPPKWSANAALAFGRGIGQLEAIAWAACPVLLHAPPKLWQAHHGIVKADKNWSREVACMLWPEWSDRFARVKDADRAEAALIAHWAWRQ